MSIATATAWLDGLLGTLEQAHATIAEQRRRIDDLQGQLNTLHARLAAAEARSC